LAGFVSFPGALAAAVGLGIVQSDAGYLWGADNGLVAMYVALVLGLVVRSSLTRHVIAATDRLEFDDKALYVPPAVRRHFAVTRSRLMLIVFGLVVAVVISFLPYFSRQGNLFDIAQICVNALAVLSVTIMIGWSGSSFSDRRLSSA
jgi:hypothetical protein